MMTDFQVAMVVMGGILLLFGLATLVQARRPGRAPAGGISDRQNTDAIGADVVQLRSDLQATDGRLREVEHSLSQVRTMMRALPTKDAVHRIEMEVAEVKGDLKVNNAQTLAMTRTLGRIEDHILAEAARRAAQ